MAQVRTLEAAPLRELISIAFNSLSKPESESLIVKNSIAIAKILGFMEENSELSVYVQRLGLIVRTAQGKSGF